MRVTKVGVQLEDASNIMVMWKRGPREDFSNSFKMKPYQGEVDVDFQLQTVCTFFHNNKGGYEKKLCEFHLYQLEDGSKKLICKVDFDMSPYIGSNEEPCLIEFDSAFYSNCYI